MPWATLHRVQYPSLSIDLGINSCYNTLCKRTLTVSKLLLHHLRRLLRNDFSNDCAACLGSEAWAWINLAADTAVAYSCTRRHARQSSPPSGSCRMSAVVGKLRPVQEPCAQAQAPR